jgi:two-component system cell cycle response regulator DivK
MPHNRPLVLIVDNNRDNREMYAEYLHTRGFRVIACSDSEASVSLARSCVPDIILMELRMIGMSGLEVIDRMKREPVLAHLPVVALTASVLDFEQAAAMAAGFTEVLAKPCFPEDVERAITRLIATHPRAAAQSHKPLRAAQRAERRRRVPTRVQAIRMSVHSPR